MNTITVPREEFEQMKNELKVLRKTNIYQRLLELNKIYYKERNIHEKI